jgi:hypothetical protein
MEEIPSKMGQLSAITTAIDTGAKIAAKKATDWESLFFIIASGAEDPRLGLQSLGIRASLSSVISNKKFSVNKNSRLAYVYLAFGRFKGLLYLTQVVG